MRSLALGCPLHGPVERLGPVGCPTHSMAARYASALKQQGVAVRISAPGWLDPPAIMAARNALACVVEPNDRHAALCLLTLSKVNRKQVRDGAKLLLSLLPVFVDTMMFNSQEDWGAPYYPVVE